MIKDPCLTLFDLTICLSDAADLVCPALVNHQPDLVDAFIDVARKEYFWLDAVSPTVYRILRRETRTKTLTFRGKNMIENRLTNLICKKGRFYE